MTASILNHPRSAPPGAPRRAAPLPFPRLYRCHIAATGSGSERTAFVESSCHHGARRKVANAVAALEMCKPDDIEERIYNCASAYELIDQGSSPDVAVRVFETGWCDDKVMSYVEHPLFLVADPALIRAWVRAVGVAQ